MLSQNLYKLLQRVEARLQAVASVSEALNTKAVQELLDWCGAQDVPTHEWVTGSRVVFSMDVLETINETLLLLGQPPIHAVRSGQSRGEQALHGNREDKSGSRPKAGRVLVLQADTADAVLPVLQKAQAELVLDVAASQLDLQTPSCLLAIENLDMFYDCLQHQREGRYRLPAECNNALIVFRGHQHDAQTVLELVSHFNAVGKPTFYLGDFDPAGITIALDHAYSHVLVPGLALLQQRGYTESSPPEQQEQFERLLGRSRSWPAGHSLQPYAQVMLEQLRSLRHQRYQGALESVPLPQQTTK